jgi:hypothetical protein
LLVQQSAIAECIHACAAVLHVSVVHASPSLQSEPVLQQPGIVVSSHVCVTGSQTSIVHTLPSLQLAFVVHDVAACVCSSVGSAAWQPNASMTMANANVLPRMTCIICQEVARSRESSSG